MPTTSKDEYLENLFKIIYLCPYTGYKKPDDSEILNTIKIESIICGMNNL